MDVSMADPANPNHVAAPSNGDLWVVHVHPGDMVKAGEELFNISIMKQEKAVLAPVDGMVKRVLKSADYKTTRKMVPVREGELIVELAPAFAPTPTAQNRSPLRVFTFAPGAGISWMRRAAIPWQINGERSRQHYLEARHGQNKRR